MSESTRARRWRRQRRMLKAAAFVALLWAAVYLRTSLFPAFTGLLHRVADSQRTTNILPAKAPPSRPIYPYSVIRGGAYSAAELREALERDPVAARHYLGFRRSMVHTIDSSFTAPVYLSYRISNAIYWTSQPVRLPQGEALLTDGENYARARCGNRISQVPKTPVNDTQPTPETMDTPQPPANMVGELDTWSEDRLLFPTTTTITPSTVPTTISAEIGPINEVVNVPEWWLVSGPSGFLNVPIIAGIPRTLFPPPIIPVIQPNPIPGYPIPPTPTGFTPPTLPSPPGSPPVAVLIPPEIPPEIWPPTVPTIPNIPLVPIGPGFPVGPTGPAEAPEPALIAPLAMILGGFLVARRYRRP